MPVVVIFVNVVLPAAPATVYVSRPIPASKSMVCMVLALAVTVKVSNKPAPLPRNTQT